MPSAVGTPTTKGMLMYMCERETAGSLGEGQEGLPNPWCEMVFRWWTGARCFQTETEQGREPPFRISRGTEPRAGSRLVLSVVLTM